MYDREMFERTVLSPFLSHYDSSIAYKEMEDGILKNVRGIVIEPYQVHTLNELVAKYGCTADKIILSNVGPVIGSHSGPGTIAFFFHGKERG